MVLESNSKVLVEMLNKSYCNLWQLQNYWKETLSLASQVKLIQHQYREGNRIADALANEGIRLQGYRHYSNLAELPELARGNLTLEKAGLPYIRFKYA